MQDVTGKVVSEGLRRMRLRTFFVLILTLTIGSTAATAFAAPPHPLKRAKLDSQLAAVALDKRRSGVAAALDRAEKRSLDVEGSAVRVVVVAKRGKADEALASVASAGGEITGSHASLVEALVPVSALETLAGDASVARVRPPLRPRAEAVAGQEVVASGADAWQTYGYDGGGVKVGVVDLGFYGWRVARDNGDLPASLVTKDFCPSWGFRSTDHGTAVAEIVHEMAPKAELHLICIDSEVGLADALEYAKARGITIINHSAGWFNAGRGDGSGPAGSPDAIVAEAHAAGILWVNAAGNEAGRHWSGTFSDPDANNRHNFSGSDEGITVEIPSGHDVCFFLKWDDWPVSSDDYDLMLYESAGDQPKGLALEQSINEQSATAPGPPTEAVCHWNDGATQSVEIVIEKYAAGAATPRFDVFAWVDLTEHAVASGSIADPAPSPSALAVGAVCWETGALEPYSSQGPTIDGRTKPDIAGNDAVSSLTYGPFGGCGASGFTGTSAAAPHVAGAAALVKQANPSQTVGELRSALEAATVDSGDVGPDNLFGAGRLQLGAPPPDLVAPNVATMTRPTILFKLAKAFPVAWAGTDVGTGVASYDVQHYSVTPGGSTSALQLWRSATTFTSSTFTGTPGSTYCFQSAARDDAGNVSPAWSGELCAALPVDNTALAHSRRWSKKTGTGHYLGTYSLASRYGAYIRAGNLLAKRLSVLATRCSGCGTIAVRWNGALVKKISLAATRTRRRQLIPVTTFATPQAGTLTMTIVSSAKPVIIDGLAVSSK